MRFTKPIAAATLAAASVSFYALAAAGQAHASGRIIDTTLADRSTHGGRILHVPSQSDGEKTDGSPVIVTPRPWSNLPVVEFHDEPEDADDFEDTLPEPPRRGPRRWHRRRGQQVPWKSLLLRRVVQLSRRRSFPGRRQHVARAGRGRPVRASRLQSDAHFPALSRLQAGLQRPGLYRLPQGLFRKEISDRQLLIGIGFGKIRVRHRLPDSCLHEAGASLRARV